MTDDEERIATEADRIVEAIAHRSEQDAGLTLDQVQQLLVLRVREEAERLGIRPRALMGAVWRAWERQNRPPMLGPSEAQRVVDRLVERGLLRVQERPGGEPALLWCGLQGEALERFLASMEPPLDHEEQLFVEGIRRHLTARQEGNWFSWEGSRQ
jgi:hypothetical protein